MTTEKPGSEGEAAGREAAAPRLLDTPDRINLKRIKAFRSSGMLAEKLQEQILGGAYPPGSSRPNERALGCETPEYPGACNPQPCAVDNMAGPSIAFGTFIEKKNTRSARESCHERNRTRAGSSLR